MTARHPLFTQGGSTSAEEDRALVAACFPVTGIVSPADLAVTQNGTPNMSVNVATGRCVMPGTESATLQGRYIGWLDATLNVAIAASDPTNPRIDLIVAKTQDAQYSGATNAFSVVAVTGTPAGSPVAPATPNNAIVLARVAVAASVTTIVTANITDVRNGTGDTLPIVGLQASFPFPPFQGLGIYQITGNPLEGLYFYDGVAWRLPWNMPWGNVAESTKVTNQAAIGTTEVDVSGLSVTWTAVANRKYRISVSGGWVTIQTAGNVPDLFITDALNGHLQTSQGWQSTVAATAQTGAFFAPIQSPSAGSVTYKVRASTNTATCTVVASAAAPWVMTVDDVGPNGSPS